MSDPSGPKPGVPRSSSEREAAVHAALTETSRQLRAPWAASVAGLAFAVLFTLALVLLRNLPITSMSDAELADWFASGNDIVIVVAGLYLTPFAGIAFLWFIAVVRDQIGEREDRFFATVFFGSGLLFVALLFVASAVVSSIAVGVRYLGQAPPSAEDLALLRSLAYATLYAFATRAAALFLLSTATIGRRSGTFPRWFAIIGYLLGVLLLVVVNFWDWLILLLPGWVAFVSLFILLRERARRGAHLGRDRARPRGLRAQPPCPASSPASG